MDAAGEFTYGMNKVGQMCPECWQLGRIGACGSRDPDVDGEEALEVVRRNLLLGMIASFRDGLEGISSVMSDR